MVAGVEDGGHGQVEGRLAAGRAHGTDPSLQRGDAFFQDGHCRIRDPGVQVPADLQVEQAGSVVNRVEHVRRGLVDGDGPRTGGRVGALTGVQGAGVEAVVVGFDHGPNLRQRPVGDRVRGQDDTVPANRSRAASDPMATITSPSANGRLVTSSVWNRADRSRTLSTTAPVSWRMARSSMV